MPPSLGNLVLDSSCLQYRIELLAGNENGMWLQERDESGKTSVPHFSDHVWLWVSQLDSHHCVSLWPICIGRFFSNSYENWRYSGKLKFISSMHVLCMIFLSLNPHYNNLKTRSLRFFLPLSPWKQFRSLKKRSRSYAGNLAFHFSQISFSFYFESSTFLLRFLKPPSNFAAKSLHRLAEHEMLLALI